MARNQTSAEKRHAQSEKRRMRNKAIKSECRTYAKQFVELVLKKDKDASAAKLKQLQSALDSARLKGVVSLNAASRKKSRMTRLYNNTFVKQAAAN